MKSILEIQQVSKRFFIHHELKPYLSFRDKLAGIFKRKDNLDEEFWALKNISFGVQQGESIGIIGRNGAGKSTLLKILSRITPPTRGKIISRGRIASLLEVGTGFHPELTGRENIYFNGSILGMKRREIDTKFDEIVDFAGTEKFLDTPLKHYSSGMQLRLAFSVAAFLEPEILIIDEVLAVGDLEFQKKCLGKMEGVSSSGRTLLFVSHQLGMVSKLCQRAIILDQGEIKHIGEADTVIDTYTKMISTGNEFIDSSASGQKNYHINRVRTINNAGEKVSNFAHNEEVVIHIDFFFQQELKNTNLLVAVNNRNGQRIFSADLILDQISMESDSVQTAKLRIPKDTLTPNNYSLFVAIHCPNTLVYDLKDNVCPFTVYDNGSEFSQYEGRWFYGDVFVKCNWEIDNH